MGKTEFRAAQERAEAEVGQGQDDVEVLGHVTVVEQVVAVEPEEEPRALDAAVLRLVHAPVQGLIDGVVKAVGQECPPHDGGAPQRPARRDEG